MNLFGLLGLSGSAMAAQRQRAEVIASNMANAETTRTAQGGPFRRQHVIFSATRLGHFGRLLPASGDLRVTGVRVRGVVADSSDPVRRYDPGHPDANEEGYVDYPAINPLEEMVNLMNATRSYQLNASAVQATKGMIEHTLQLLA